MSNYATIESWEKALDTALKTHYGISIDDTPFDIQFIGEKGSWRTSDPIETAHSYARSCDLVNIRQAIL